MLCLAIFVISGSCGGPPARSYTRKTFSCTPPMSSYIPCFTPSISLYLPLYILHVPHIPLYVPYIHPLYTLPPMCPHMSPTTCPLCLCAHPCMPSVHLHITICPPCILVCPFTFPVCRLYSPWPNLMGLGSPILLIKEMTCISLICIKS